MVEDLLVETTGNGGPRGATSHEGVDWLVFLKNAAVSRPALNSKASHIGEFALP